MFLLVPPRVLFPIDLFRIGTVFRLGVILFPIEDRVSGDQVYQETNHQLILALVSITCIHLMFKLSFSKTNIDIFPKSTGFSNAPPPSGDHEGSGLLSGLIQLSSKRIPSQPSQFRESASRSRSRSCSPSKSSSPRRQHLRQRHHSPISSGLFQNQSKSQSPPKE